MNEALETAYMFFTEQGYNGSIEEFVKLINTDTDALDLSYTLFTEEGYAGSFDDFSGLMGVKKKEETEINTDSKSEIGISQPNTLSRNQRLNVGAGPEKDTAIERAFGKNEVTDFFGDLYRAWKTGAGQGATVDDALKVFASGSNVSEENLQDYIDAVQNMDSFSPSEEMQDFSRIYEAEGKGIKGFLKGIYKNPTAAIQVALSSLRAMINPGSVAAGAAGAGTGAAIGSAGLALAPITSTVGAGAGAIFGMTGALETGLSFTEFLREELNKKGLDFTDDNIRTILEDDEAMGNITRRSLARGATISSISALTGGLAAGVGANIGKNVAMKLGTTAGRAAAGAAGIGVQAIGGGTGEALGRAAAGQEMDVAEIGFEAIGEVASPSIIGTIRGMAKVPKYEVNEEKVTEETVIDIINKSTNYLELDNTDIKITDSPLIEQALNDKKKQLLDEFTMENSLTPEQLEKASKQDIQDLVSLQNQYDNAKEDKTLAGQKKAAKYKEQFENKLNAIQKQSTEEVDVSKPAADSKTVGKGDTEQQSTTRKDPSEPVTDSTKQTKEVTTQVEDDASTLIVIDSKDKKLEKAGYQVSKDEKSEFLQDIKDRGRDESSFSYEIKEINEVPSLDSVPVDNLGQVNIDGKRKTTADITVTYTNPDGTTESFDSTVALEPFVETEQVTQEEVVEEVAPATNKIGNFDVVIENNKVVSVTKKGKKATSSSQRNVAEKIISTGAIDVDAGQDSPNPGQTTKPRSIAINIERLKKEIKDQVTDFENMISGSGIESLFGTKFTSQSIKDYFGKSPSQMGPGFIQTWVATKEKGGQNISDGFTDSTGLFFDADAVAAFIETNFSKKQFKSRIEGDLKSELKLEREKFTEVTGLPSQPKIVGLVANAPTQEEVQQKASEEAVKSAQEEAQKIEDDKLKEARKKGQEDIKNIQQEKETRRLALANIKKGKLGTELSTEVLQKIFTIDPKIIRSLIKSEDLPPQTLERYNALAKLIGQREAVLIDLPTAAQIKKEADSLYNILVDGVNEQIEKVSEATTEEEVDVKSLKDEIINMVVKINKSLDFPSRELAQKIKNLTSKDLDLLITTTEDGNVDVKKLEQLILIKKNIDAGFVPAAANDIINLVETKKDSQSTTPKILNIAIRGLQSGLRKAIFDIGKALNIIQNGNFFDAVFKSNPKTVIDDLLGNANDTTIFEKLIRPLASAFAGFDVDRNKVLKQIIGAAEKLIAFDGNKRIERSQNEIVYDKIKIMTYLLQLQHESNPLQSDKTKTLTPAAIDFLNANIDYYIAKSPLESDVSLKMYADILNDYVVDGEVNLKKLKDSFSPNINKAVELYRKGFDDLAVKTNYVSTILRRNKVDIFNNYVKHAVMYGTKKASDRLEADNIRTKKLESFLKASTKSGSIEERTGGANAIYFDPSYALMKASDDILLDFNMTNAIRQFRMKIDELRKIEGLTPLQIQALDAIEDSMEKALTSTFDSINSDPSATQSFLSFMRRVGYEATLVSMPRAAAELSSNFLFAISANPDALMDGINNYKDVVMNVEVMLNFLNNINSTEATKLANVDELTGKFTDDQGITKYTNATGKAAPQIKNLISQILNSTLKPIREFTSELSNKMLSYPDQMIGRPLYIGEFVRVFQEETGIKLTQDDIIKMSEGPGKSKYLTLEYAEAIKKAGIAADKQAIMSTTSRNPILAIEKFKRNPKANAFKQIYIEANSFMANFFAFEYTTARTAVNALFNQGSISEKQALGLLLGVTLRMSFYTILYQVISDQFDQMFRDKEDDDMDEAQEILDLAGRSMTGSILTLLTRQTMGNVPFTAIAYGLERFNENNLGVLRSGEEYDPYKHSIVYSQLGKKDLENEDLLSNLGNVFAGPYKPFLNFADRYYDEIQRQSKSKKPKTKKQQDDLTQRMALEIGGNAGLLPFYKDIRRIILRMQYEEREKTKTGSLTKTELRKRNPRLYKKLYGPGSADARLRALRRKLKSN
jgi:hypothetical protein